MVNVTLWFRFSSSQIKSCNSSSYTRADSYFLIFTNYVFGTQFILTKKQINNRCLLLLRNEKRAGQSLMQTIFLVYLKKLQHAVIGRIMYIIDVTGSENIKKFVNNLLINCIPHLFNFFWTTCFDDLMKFNLKSTVSFLRNSRISESTYIYFAEL